MEYLENKTFDEINVGDSAILTRSLTQEDIQIFAIMSGDINPAHVDQEYASSEMFHEIIGHGMWGAALISTVLGTQLPGPGTIYLGQTLRFKKPVTIGDTLTITVTAIKKQAEKKRVIFHCVCTNQRDQTVMEGEAEVIAPVKKIRRPKAILPQLSLRRSSSFFEAYLKEAKQFSPLVAGIIRPIHEKIILAVDHAYQDKLITPILIGPKKRIETAAIKANVDISNFELIHVDHSHLVIQKALQLAKEKKIELIVRGGVTKEELLKHLRNPNNGLLKESIMSYAAVLDVPTYPKPLILTDTAVNMLPDLETKRLIIQNVIAFAQALKIHHPKVAILAGAEVVTDSMPSTVDAAALCKMAERGQIVGGILDGPLTFDNVISVEVAKEKGIHSEVVGNADILIVPNVETGNILLNQFKYLSEAKSAGLMLGGRVPVLMSHIKDTNLSNVSCALAILSQQHKKSNKI